MTDSADELTPEAVATAKKIFRGEDPQQSGCIHCAGIHDRVFGLPAHRQPCPRVKRAVWHGDDTLLEVEYWAHGSWPWEDVVFPSDVFGEDDIEGSS